MKNSLRIAALLVAFGAATSGALICSAQPGKIVGGYREVAKTDETVVYSANFAIKTQAQKDASLKLISIAGAERQIVAGSNYRLCLVVNSENKPEEIKAVVYQSLQNEFSLTSWESEKCAPKETAQKTDSGDSAEENSESATFKGQLEVGKLESAIMYLGEETGDVAAFCFLNNSEAGRAVLAACKNGEQCEFTGKVDYEKVCKIKAENLSASAKIVSIESVKTLAGKNGADPKTPIAAIAPDMVVKNLYAAQKVTAAAPFFQTVNRAAVNRYFTKDFADLIWKDAITAKGEVGAFDFDPLYHAQDTKITAFTIGKPEFDANSEVANVLVSFKNMNKSETVKFLLKQDAAKTWKIMDIVYRNGDMLKGILSSAQTESKGAR